MKIQRVQWTVSPLPSGWARGLPMFSRMPRGYVSPLWMLTTDLLGRSQMAYFCLVTAYLFYLLGNTAKGPAPELLSLHSLSLMSLQPRAAVKKMLLDHWADKLCTRGSAGGHAPALHWGFVCAPFVPTSLSPGNQLRGPESHVWGAWEELSSHPVVGLSSSHREGLEESMWPKANKPRGLSWVLTWEDNRPSIDRSPKREGPEEGVDSERFPSALLWDSCNLYHPSSIQRSPQLSSVKSSFPFSSCLVGKKMAPCVFCSLSLCL